MDKQILFKFEGFSSIFSIKQMDSTSVSEYYEYNIITALK